MSNLDDMIARAEGSLEHLRHTKKSLEKMSMKASVNRVVKMIEDQEKHLGILKARKEASK